MLQHHCTRIVMRLLGLCLLILSPAWAATPAGVLVLNSHQYGVPIPDNITRGAVAALTEHGVGLERIYVEHLDLLRPGADIPALAAQLGHKLAGREVGLVITITQPAYDFIQQYPIVPAGVPLLASTAPTHPPGLVRGRHPSLAVPWQPDIAATLASMRRLFPERSRLLVITGANDRFLPVRDALQQALEQMAQPFEAELTDRLGYEQMLARVRNQPDDALILYSPYFSDLSGRSFIPADVALQVSALARQPLFVTLDAYVDDGVLGGVVLRTADIGRQMGTLAAQLLRGERPFDPSLLAGLALSEPQFHWRQLGRWQLTRAQLPAGSRILGEPASLWREHRWLLLGGGAVMALLALMLVLLTGQNLRRASSEQLVRRLNQELEKQVRTDFLTGLYNRRYMMALLEQELARAGRYGSPFSLVMLDIDLFKQINDTYGHGTGDRVLMHVAALCRETLRKMDVVARIGGEEFLLLLPETGEEEARMAAERLRQIIQRRPYRQGDGQWIGVTVSMGIAGWRAEDDDMDPLLKRADDALYLAKRLGRNRVCDQREQAARMAAGATAAARELNTGQPLSS
jgi:diguanylate cyclase (GGDEF)-like protein